MEYQPLEFREFHGGITENFIDAPPIQYEKADNYLVTVNRKLYTRPGSEINDAVNYQIPAGSQRIGTYIDHYGTLLTQSSKKLYHVVAGADTELTGPSGNSVFTQGDTTSRVTWGDWNRHTYVGNDDFSPMMKIFEDAAGDLQVRSAGLPDLASTPTLASTGPADVNNYIYAFVYSYEYNVETVQYEDLGPVTLANIQLITSPDTNTVNITAIPVLANSTDYNWDTANIKVKIYRTQANGTTLNYLGEVTNGTTTYNDSTADSTILNSAVLYTGGGQLENSPPPLCKAFHVTDTLGLYGHIKTADGQIISNRVRQSIPDDPDSCPDTLYVDLDDSIVAISSAGQTPVVLCEKIIYRLDGQFSALGDGLLEAQEIESTVGCISLNSVVQVQRGVCFAGDTGFYFTDGWEVRKLSNNFNKTYRDFTLTDEQKERIYGTFDRNDKRIWWAVQESGETEVNKCYVLDTRYGLGVAQNDLEYVQSTFTTASNGDDFRPTALIFKDGDLIRGDSRGYTFRHREGLTSDPLIDTSLAPSLWATKTIIWDFISVATSFGSSLKRKFVPRVTFTAENETNITVQIVSINDIGKQSKGVRPIRFRKNWVWGDPTKTWSQETAIWNFRGVIEQERRFHSDSLRCSYKQIQVTNAFDLILNSDDLVTATVNAATKTLTLDNIVDYDWPIDVKDQFLYFEDDNYLTAFPILARTDDVLTYSDPTNKIQSGSKKWSIRGYAKSEVLNLISIALWYAYLGQPADYASVTAGSNP